MSDARDLLGVGSAPAKKDVIKQEPKANSSRKRPINRELQGLRSELNDDLEVEEQPIPLFKEQLAQEVHWKRLKIESSAKRSISLYHWTKVYTVPDYRFAKNNRTIKMLRFTDEEYNALLQKDSWSRSQTDRLFDLCTCYDLRFLVVHDRFTAPPLTDQVSWAMLEAERKEIESGDSKLIASNQKTVEDLKDRFYTIQAKLKEARTGVPAEGIKYDVNHEIQRKQGAALLCSRTKAEELELARLLAERRTLSASITMAKLQQRLASDPSRHLAEIPQHLIPAPRKVVAGCRLRSEQVLDGMNKAVSKELEGLGFRPRPLFTKNTKPLGTQTKIFDAPNQTIAELFDHLKRNTQICLNLADYVEEKEAEKDNLRSGSKPKRSNKKSKRK